MLYNKFNLEVSKFAGDSYGSKPELGGVFFTSRATAASDGYKLIEVSVPSELKPEEYPSVNGKKAMRGCRPFIVPAPALKEIKINNGSSLPILNCIGVGHLDKEKVEFLNTNLDESEIKTIKKIEAKYPDYQQLFNQEKPVLEISVNAKYLKEIMDFMSKFVDTGSKEVKIKLYGSNKPIMFTAENNSTRQKVRALLMPITTTK